MSTMPLPPGVTFRNGGLYRTITVESDGQPRKVRRPVALSLEEARKQQADYYHPQYGWIRGGRKMEKEHPLVEASVLAQAGIVGDDEDEE